MPERIGSASISVPDNPMPCYVGMKRAVFGFRISETVIDAKQTETSIAQEST